MPIFSDLKDSPPREGEVKPTLAAPRPLRRWLAAAAVLMGASLPAQAAITQLIFVNSYDGTSGWDVAAGPGFDTDAHNGIVRTNDQFEYLATFSTSGGDNNLTPGQHAPAGQRGAARGPAGGALDQRAGRLHRGRVHHLGRRPDADLQPGQRRQFGHAVGVPQRHGAQHHAQRHRPARAQPDGLVLGHPVVHSPARRPPRWPSPPRRSTTSWCR
jgi:hypothetical protein